MFKPICLFVGFAVFSTLACSAVSVKPSTERLRNDKNIVALPPKQVIPAGWIEHRTANATPTLAYRWVDILLEVTGREVVQVGARPTIISRQMAIPMTAMYEAWAAYDDKASGIILGNKLRRPQEERTQANKEKAISYAMYRTLLNIFPKDKEWLSVQMNTLGYAPEEESTDISTPQGVGNVVAATVIESRRHDGSNQYGDEVGSSTGKPYSDYTFYEPRNPIDRVVEPNRWQQIPFDDGKGGKFYPNFLTPHWYRVQPTMLDRSDQFRPPVNPKVGSEELRQQVEECVVFNGSLSLEQKSVVEFMRDGPRSTGQSGHWLQFAQDVSRRDRFTLDQDVKLFFTIANTAFDAFIACWEAKRFYDSSRPWTLIRMVPNYYVGQKIMGYAGPGKGFAMIPAEQWHPYSPDTFVTPPFPSYPSGHSTVSGACAKMLELFTGSDRYGAYYRHRAGQWTEAGISPKQMQAIGGKVSENLADENAQVTLMLPTFTATADMAGISRVMGGYHIQADNIQGLALGRKIAQFTWTKYQAYFDGTATKAIEASSGK